jgi:hypothetical protein
MEYLIQVEKTTTSYRTFAVHADSEELAVQKAVQKYAPLYKFNPDETMHKYRGEITTESDKDTVKGCT